MFCLYTLMPSPLGVAPARGACSQTDRECSGRVSRAARLFRPESLVHTKFYGVQCLNMCPSSLLRTQVDVTPNGYGRQGQDNVDLMVCGCDCSLADRQLCGTAVVEHLKARQPTLGVAFVCLTYAL